MTFSRPLMRKPPERRMRLRKHYPVNIFGCDLRPLMTAVLPTPMIEVLLPGNVVQVSHIRSDKRIERLTDVSATAWRQRTFNINNFGAVSLRTAYQFSNHWNSKATWFLTLTAV